MTTWSLLTESIISIGMTLIRTFEYDVTVFSCKCNTLIDNKCCSFQLYRTPKPRTWNIKSTKTQDKSHSFKKSDDSRPSLGTRRSGRLQSQAMDQTGN